MPKTAGVTVKHKVVLTRAWCNQEGDYLTVKIYILPVYPENPNNDEGKELKPPAHYVLLGFLPFLS